MLNRITALLVLHNSDMFIRLQAVLQHLGVRVTHAESRAQTRRLLGVQRPVPLVFTDTHLPDGTWADILAVAEKAALPVNVIVVARVVNTRLYIETMEAGAFDFLVPPFNATDLTHVIRCAADNVLRQRATLPQADHAA